VVNTAGPRSVTGALAVTITHVSVHWCMKEGDRRRRTNGLRDADSALCNRLAPEAPPAGTRGSAGRTPAPWPSFPTRIAGEGAVGPARTRRVVDRVGDRCRPVRGAHSGLLLDPRAGGRATRCRAAAGAGERSARAPATVAQQPDHDRVTCARARDGDARRAAVCDHRAAQPLSAGIDRPGGGHRAARRVGASIDCPDGDRVAAKRPSATMDRPRTGGGR
jgi:hypothetical protein